MVLTVSTVHQFPTHLNFFGAVFLKSVKVEYTGHPYPNRISSGVGFR